MNHLFEKFIAKWYAGTIEEIVGDWKWIFSYSKKYKGAIFFYCLLGILNTTLGLGLTLISKFIIDIVTSHDSSRFGLLALAMIGSYFLNITVSNLFLRLNTRIHLYIENDVRGDIFDTIIDSDWMEISKYSNGDLLARFIGDIGTVSDNAVKWVPSLLISIYSFIATFTLILHYDVIMAIFAFANAPFTLLISKIVLKRQREYGKKVREINSSLLTFESETFYNFDTIKSFGILEQFSRKLREWQNKQKDMTLEYNLFTIKTNIFMQSTSSFVTFVAFMYCLFRLWNNDITYGTMTLFLSTRSNLTSAFNTLIHFIPDMIRSSVSAHRVRELVELPKEVHIEKSKKLEPYKEQGLTVQMVGVNYSYLEGKRVISNSDFIAKPGEIVALVGPSGEGKTTMIRLMLGLIHPGEGDVTIRSLTGESVPANADTRHLFAYVPQGNSILSGTIADNMRMAKEDATDDEIINALDIAWAWDFVSKLENGINNKVGERGKGLSEGQAQRIAIARAILRDAPILLLDEATSALDVETERKVLRNIIQKQPNKTCIVTTHRPSVLNMCERVYRVIDTKVTQLSEEEASRMAMDF